jgi:hypothetical protein
MPAGETTNSLPLLAWRRIAGALLFPASAAAGFGTREGST